MNTAFQNLHDQLEAAAQGIEALSAEDRSLFQINGNQWNMPMVDRHQLADAARDIASIIKQRADDTEDEARDAYALKLAERISFMQGHLFPYFFNGNAAVSVPTYLVSMQSMKDWVLKVLPENVHLDATLVPTRLARKARVMQRQLDSLEINEQSIRLQISTIREAYDTVENLPNDIEDLRNAKKQIEDAGDEIIALTGKVNDAYTDANTTANLMQRLKNQTFERSEAILRQAGAAYSSATTKGLAHAFRLRGQWLGASMWVWVILLICTLLLAVNLGAQRVQVLSVALADTDPKWGVVMMHLILSFVSIGAPLWFAWVATKQLAQLFRISEDYGYKAAVAKAYQGYKAEAALVDPQFEHRLFAIALERLGEAPLRLVDTQTHGSPWHELLESSRFGDALDKVPGLASAVLEKAQASLARKTPEAKE